MDLDKQLDMLREMIVGLRDFEEELSVFLGPEATGSQIDRCRLTRDAVQRCRRQIGHLAAELVLAVAVEALEPNIRIRSRVAGVAADLPAKRAR